MITINNHLSNCLGMFVILSEQWNLDGRYSLLTAIGFCDSLTTMSSFALDSSNLLDNHHYGTLTVNLIATYDYLLMH